MPEEGPVVDESGTGGGKVGEKTVDEGDAGDVKRNIEAATEVMVCGID